LRFYDAVLKSSWLCFCGHTVLYIVLEPPKLSWANKLLTDSLFQLQVLQTTKFGQLRRRARVLQRLIVSCSRSLCVDDCWLCCPYQSLHTASVQRTEEVHLHTPALRIGTHFLLTLETVVFVFHLLSTTSKPFSPLSTRLAHAARLGFFYIKRAI